MHLHRYNFSGYTLIRVLCLVVLLAFWLGLSSCSSNPASPLSQQVDLDYGLIATTPEQPILYGERVKPILERRCVVCHGCYDAPCQLKLSSHQGLSRGASKERIYDGERITGATPTRLFIDASTTEQWRAKGFSRYWPKIRKARKNLCGNP